MARRAERRRARPPDSATTARSSWTRTSTRPWRPSAGRCNQPLTRTWRTSRAAPSSCSPRSQRPDGYLNSYIQASGDARYGSLASSHEMYCDGHFFQAAVALSRSGTAGQQAMDIATKLADHLVKEFAGQRKGLDGHPIVETALVELYRATGTAAYRDLAAQFVEQRGRGLVGDSGYGRRYLQDHEPVRETTTEVGHAVRALYLDAGVTDVATETNDAQLLATSEARWADMVATKTALTGGNGSRHNDEAFGDRFELPPGPRLQRDVRRDRELPVELAPPARHRRSQVRRPHGADPLQRLRGSDQHGRRPVLLRQPVAAPRGPLREGRPGPPPRMVQDRLLPAEHHAPPCLPPPLRGDSGGDTLTVHQYAAATVAGAGLTWRSAPTTPGRAGHGPGDRRAPPKAERELALRIPAWSAAAGPVGGRVNGSPERFVFHPTATSVCAGRGGQETCCGCTWT